MASHESITDHRDPRTKDLTGQRFHQLTVVTFAGYRQQRAYWVCRCDCGQVINRSAKVLQAKCAIKSCGCGRYRHGISPLPRAAHAREYLVFCAMWSRCTNPNDQAWPAYGGRGITVCTRWQNFDTFLEDMGPRPSAQHSMDRYPDMNGNYEPGNVRWATYLEQCGNTRRNLYFTIDGITHHLAQWVRLYKQPYTQVYKRLKRGWPIEQALKLPPAK